MTDLVELSMLTKTLTTVYKADMSVVWVTLSSHKGGSCCRPSYGSLDCINQPYVRCDQGKCDFHSQILQVWKEMKSYNPSQFG